MFLESSRYYKLKTVDAVSRNWKKVSAVSLRRLPAANGVETIVKGNDRLDIISLRQYSNSTKFWHIADANTDLEANNLVREPGRKIKVPEK